MLIRLSRLSDRVPVLFDLERGKWVVSVAEQSWLGGIRVFCDDIWYLLMMIRRESGVYETNIGQSDETHNGIENNAKNVRIHNGIDIKKNAVPERICLDTKKDTDSRRIKKYVAQKKRCIERMYCILLLCFWCMCTRMNKHCKYKYISILKTFAKICTYSSFAQGYVSFTCVARILYIRFFSALLSIFFSSILLLITRRFNSLLVVSFSRRLHCFIWFHFLLTNNIISSFQSKPSKKPVRLCFTLSDYIYTHKTKYQWNRKQTYK